MPNVTYNDIIANQTIRIAVLESEKHELEAQVSGQLGQLANLQARVKALLAQLERLNINPDESGTGPQLVGRTPNDGAVGVTPPGGVNESAVD